MRKAHRKPIKLPREDWDFSAFAHSEIEVFTSAVLALGVKAAPKLLEVHTAAFDYERTREPHRSKPAWLNLPLPEQAAFIKNAMMAVREVPHQAIDQYMFWDGEWRPKALAALHDPSDPSPPARVLVFLDVCTSQPLAKMVADFKNIVRPRLCGREKDIRSSPMAALWSEAPPLADDEIRPAIPNNANWFRDEIHVHEGQLKAYLRQRFCAVRDVDDIVQESYLRVWKRQLLKPIDSARAFLFSVARHLALDAIRHEHRSPISPHSDLTSLNAATDTTDVHDTACSKEEVALLLKAIERLAPRTREVYILRKFHNVPQAEIAHQLRISPKTVEVHVGRANKQCEHFLRRRGVIGGAES